MTKELEGQVLRSYNGYYYVKVRGEPEEYVCKLKGKLKLSRFSIVTGDFVVIEAGSGREGMLKSVLARRNFLPRPAIANLDVLVATFALASPAFSFLVADKLLMLAALAGIPSVLALNKIDAGDPETVEKVRSVYAMAGYDVYPVSARTGEGIGALSELLQGKVCAFGGPSGAGKSTTVNAIDPTAAQRTGSVSVKTGRGRHTTCYARLLPFDGGYIADTPGFGNLAVLGLSPASAAEGFREFRKHADGCHFKPCSHTHEPVCGVKKAVSEGLIAKSRYESYLAILGEIKSLRQVQEAKEWKSR